MTATPHSGKEEDYQLFLSLLDSDRFYGKFRDGVHKVDASDLMRRMVKEEQIRLSRCFETFLVGTCTEAHFRTLRKTGTGPRFPPDVGGEDWARLRVARNIKKWATWATRSVSKGSVSLEESGGRHETRTRDLLVANEALFQLS